MDGGEMRKGMRSSALNVPGIVGFGRAAKLAKRDGCGCSKTFQYKRPITKSAYWEFRRNYVNGDQNHRIPHVTNIFSNTLKAKVDMIVNQK